MIEEAIESVKVAAQAFLDLAKHFGIPRETAIPESVSLIKSKFENLEAKLRQVRECRDRAPADLLRISDWFDELDEIINDKSGE